MIYSPQNAKEYNANDCNRYEHSEYNISCAFIDMLFALELIKHEQIADQHTESENKVFVEMNSGSIYAIDSSNANSTFINLGTESKCKARNRNTVI